MVRKTRKDAGREETPSYAIIDSQSVKTVLNSENRGIDGGKTKGRKRYIVVDVMGNLLSVIVHAANIHDTKAGILPPDQHTKDTRLFKNFVLTLSIEVLFCLI